MTHIRLVTIEDSSQITEIYSPSVLNAATSFETELPSESEMQTRIQTILQKFPWIVCEVDGKIAGYVYASKHRDREAYQWSCECSIYMNSDFKGKGIGTELYRLLFQVLKRQGFRNVYARITLPNEASISIHERCGFKHFATYDSIGYKFGHWHSVGWWKLQINDYDLQPPPPLKFSELDSQMLYERFNRTAQNIQSKLTG
ncbi:MAG TPA: GNAT family N-acetyltransferase [Flavisolibacter sp.]|jgi:phosphinothricin acetyltransferase|nr:GNAT family N-acetyltransferase [Flavisolibacter sp.]